MERDSNPRYFSEYFGFQDRLFKPLRHPSLSRQDHEPSIINGKARSFSRNQLLIQLNMFLQSCNFDLLGVKIPLERKKGLGWHETIVQRGLSRERMDKRSVKSIL